MKRLSDEDGMGAGWRNIGRLALATIPYVLGIGALVWLGFFVAAHGWLNELAQEGRRAVYVGAEHPPKAPLRIETPAGCFKIDRVDLEGSSASLYFTNNCGDVTYPKAHWQLVSPDGTLLESGSAFVSLIGGPQKMSRGERGEATFSGFSYGISTDKRAAAIRFWIEP